MRCPRATIALALTGCLCAAACRGAERQADQLRDSAASWAATLRLACEEWLRGAVPSHLVLSTTTAATANLESEAQRVRSKLGADASAPADAVLAAVPLLNAAIDRDDRSGALAVARALVEKVRPRPTPAMARPR